MRTTITIEDTPSPNDNLITVNVLRTTNGMLDSYAELFAQIAQMHITQEAERINSECSREVVRVCLL